MDVMSDSDDEEDLSVPTVIHISVTDGDGCDRILSGEESGDNGKRISLGNPVKRRRDGVDGVSEEMGREVGIE